MRERETGRRRLRPGTRGFVVLLGALSGLTAFGIDISLPALPELGRVFAAGPETTQLTLSAFVAAFGLAQLAVGPLSDQFGRRPVLLGGLLLYAAAGLGCAASGSIEQLVVFRALQGVGASVGRVLVPAIVRDSFPPLAGSSVLSSVTVVVALAPLVAPLLGGWLLGPFGWPSVFLVLGIAGLALFVATCAGFAESAPRLDPRAADPVTMLRNYRALVRSRALLGYAISNACAFAGLFAYISASPFVLIESFGVSPDAFGLYFGINAFGLMGGAVANRRLLRAGMAGGRVLGLGLALQLGAGAAVLGFALLDSPQVGVAGVVAPILVYVFALGMVMPNATAAAMAPLPQMAGLASSLLGSFQMLLGSVSGWVASHFFDGRPLAMAVTVASLSASAAMAYATLVPRVRT